MIPSIEETLDQLRSVHRHEIDKINHALKLLAEPNGSQPTQLEQPKPKAKSKSPRKSKHPIKWKISDDSRHRAMEFIHQHRMEDLTNADFEEALHISSAHARNITATLRAEGVLRLVSTSGDGRGGAHVFVVNDGG